MRLPRILRATCCFAVALLVGSLPAPSHADDENTNRLRVGTCVREITPISPLLTDEYEAKFGGTAVVNHTDPIFMAGFGDNRRATDYNDRLWARGVVVDHDGMRVAIVSLDVVGYFKNEIDTIRALVSPDSEVDFVVVSSTHQHEGPDTLGIWGPNPLTSGIDFGYLDFVNASVADCIDEAASQLEPALLYYATTDTTGLSIGTDPEDDGFGVGDGKVLVGDAALAPATGGRIVDPLLTSMVFAADEPGDVEVMATLVNFGSHPESLGSGNTLITSDFPHYVRERIEDVYGGVAIWLAGDLGVLQGPLDIDVLDPVTNAAAPRRTFRFAEVHGTQLADRAIDAIDSVMVKFDNDGERQLSKKNGDKMPDIRFATVDPVAIRMDNPFFRFFIAIGVLNVRRDLYTNGSPDASVGFPFPPPFDTLPQALADDIHTEVSALQIGDGAIAVVPTELDPQIGNGYRAALAGEGASHTLIAGLANDHIGYQLPQAKWDDSCHFCAPFILAGVPQFCPVQPIDCNTVFQNNVGQLVDPEVSGAFFDAVDDL